ncbi:ATP-dependent DNA helicase PcrA [Pelomyxa schiedti]|nr:ATP-dependent DNA helicase PcrA [Pelomyxa schiedti]
MTNYKLIFLLIGFRWALDNQLLLGYRISLMPEVPIACVDPVMEAHMLQRLEGYNPDHFVGNAATLGTLGPRSARANRNLPRWDAVSRRVSTWSILDLRNENLLESELFAPVLGCTDALSYYESFWPLLVEEVHARLRSKLDFAIQIEGRLEVANSDSVFMLVNFDGFKLIKGDFVLLSSRITGDQHSASVGLVDSICKDSIPGSQDYKVRIYTHTSHFFLPGKFFHIKLLFREESIQALKQVFDFIGSAPETLWSPILRASLLQASCSPVTENHCCQCVGNITNVFRLCPEQSQAITAVHSRPGVSIIHGKYGTGRTACALSVALVHTQCCALRFPPEEQISHRTLLCLPTDSTVRLVAERLHNLSIKDQVVFLSQNISAKDGVLTAHQVISDIKMLSKQYRIYAVSHSKDDLETCLKTAATVNVLQSFKFFRCIIESLKKCVSPTFSGDSNLTKLLELSDLTLSREAETSLLHELLLSSICVVCSVQMIPQLLDCSTFEMVVIDDASMLCEYETLLLLSLCTTSLCLVGDPDELPAPCASRLASECGLDYSLIYRIFHSKCANTSQLSIQHREAHVMETEWQPPPDVPGGNGLINLCEGEADFQGTEEGGFLNLAEIKAINILLRKANLPQNYRIGVACPYESQRKGIKSLTSNHDKLKVGLPNDFVGIDVDVMIVSYTITQHVIALKKDPFLPHEVGLLLSRASKATWVLGDVKAMSRSLSWKFGWEPIASQNIETIEFFVQHLKTNSDLTFLSRKESSNLDNLQWNPVVTQKFINTTKGFSQAHRHVIVHCFLHGLASGKSFPSTLPARKVLPPETSSKRDLESIATDLLYVTRVDFFDLSIIWAIGLDLEKREQSRIFFDLCPFQEEVQAIRSNVKLLLSAYSPQQIMMSSTGGHKRPFKWTPQDWDRDLAQFLSPDFVGHSTEPDPTVKEQSLLDTLSKKKLYRVSNRINAIMKENFDRDLEMDLWLTPEEEDLVSRSSSLLIHGRSGTGKTTVLLRMMHCRQSAASNNRQLFLTVSPILCESAKRAAGISSTTGSLIDEVTEDSLHNTIPSSFLQLRPEHFPLFLTYKKFLDMLDNSLPIPFLRGSPDTDALHSKSLFKSQISTVASPKSLKVRVDFDIFMRDYWLKMPTELRKGLLPEQVYTEIMSCIKGGEELFKPSSSAGHLTLEQYNDDKRRNKSLESSKVYSLFSCYNQKRLEHPDHYDDCDRIIHVFVSLRSLQRDKPQLFKEKYLKYIYVDEIQDCTPAQIALLKLVKTRDTCIVFAGDTAQAISKGVSFSFKGLRDICFDLVTGSDKSRVPPVRFLEKNFRTHRRILNIGNILTKFMRNWPDGIEDTAPETSELEGPCPSFFSGSVEDILKELFSTTNKISMGAKQVILVRNQASKTRVQKIVEMGVVLAVPESKGCEWDDVIVVNFFSDGMQDQVDWRVIYTLLTRMESVNGITSIPPGPPFDPVKHFNILSEFKNFYVAVTRARKRLLILEDTEDSNIPLIKILLACRHLSTKPGIFMDTESSENDWMHRGEQMYNTQQFLSAASCFEYAGDSNKSKLAVAMHLRKIGLEHNNVLDLKKAVTIFDELKQFTHAADVAIRLQDWQLAALFNRKLGNWNQATKFYLEAEQLREAVIMWEIDAKDPERALELSAELLPAEALRIAQTYESTIPREILTDCMKTSARIFKNNDKQTAMRQALRLVPRHDSIRLLELWGYFEDVIREYEEHNEFELAAESLERRGILDRASRFWLKAKKVTQGLSCAMRHLSCCFWNDSLAEENQEHFISEIIGTNSLVPSDLATVLALSSLSKGIKICNSRQPLCAQLWIRKKILDTIECSTPSYSYIRGVLMSFIAGVQAILPSAELFRFFASVQIATLVHVDYTKWLSDSRKEKITVALFLQEAKKYFTKMLLDYCLKFIPLLARRNRQNFLFLQALKEFCKGQSLLEIWKKIQERRSQEEPRPPTTLPNLVDRPGYSPSAAPLGENKQASNFSPSALHAATPAESNLQQPQRLSPTEDTPSEYVDIPQASLLALTRGVVHIPKIQITRRPQPPMQALTSLPSATTQCTPEEPLNSTTDFQVQQCDEDPSHSKGTTEQNHHPTRGDTAPIQQQEVVLELSSLQPTQTEVQAEHSISIPQQMEDIHELPQAEDEEEEQGEDLIPTLFTSTSASSASSSSSSSSYDPAAPEFTPSNQPQSIEQTQFELSKERIYTVPYRLMFQQEAVPVLGRIARTLESMLPLAEVTKQTRFQDEYDLLFDDLEQDWHRLNVESLWHTSAVADPQRLREHIALAEDHMNRVTRLMLRITSEKV